MLLIKTIILYLVINYIFYRMGLLINKFNKEKNLISIILYGFIATVAVLQIIYVPLILAHVSFNIVYYSTTLLILICIVASFIVCPMKKEKKIFKKSIKLIKKLHKRNIVITSILVIFILIQAITSSLLFKENADDSFYVSLMLQNIDSDSIYDREPSLGINDISHLSNYFVQGYELSVSVISKAFDIPPTILCHTIFVFIMITYSYMAYYLLLRKILKGDKVKVAMLFLTLLFLYSGFSTRLRGMILLGRMWQGKEIFLNIILTLIVSNLININNYNRKNNCAKLMLLNFAGVFFTSTAIFLIPFAYFAFGIIELIKKHWKNIVCLAITGIPILIYGVIYLLTATNKEATLGTVSITGIIKDFNGTGYYYILYIISLVIILIKGNKKAKEYFIVVPIIYALTLYNPIFKDIIAKYFTGVNVFWRLFWLLPVEISIVYAFTILIYLKNKKIYNVPIIICEILMIVISGKLVWTKENGFKKAENFSKIPNEVIIQTQVILDKSINSEKKVLVMAPPEPLHSATIRQITSNVDLFWSRDLYMHQLYPKEKLEEMSKLHDIYIKENLDINANKFKELIEKYSINWIIMDSSRSTINKFLDETKYINKYEIQGCFLYQY